ncbi:MAG: outer membrane protein transport protein [Gammaproteobacteria bacterium]
MLNRTVITVVAVAATLSPLAAFATNGYQLIGIGTYQKSLAGAVTANPGSAMTAVTNPAGSARIGRRADFSMEAFMPSRSVDFTALGGSSADSSVDAYGIPALGWSAPIRDGSPVYFGGGMYGTSGMGVDYPSTLMMTPGGGSPNLYWDGYSNISFWQMAPVVAWNVNDKLSVGASLNIDYQSVAFKQRALADTTANGQGDTVINNFDLSRSASGFGFGVSFGLLYDLSPAVTVGAAYKSKQYFNDLEYNLAAGDITVNSNPFPAGRYRLNLDYPQQFAVGVAVRPDDKLTVSADVKWVNWSDTMNKLTVKGPSGYDMPMDPGWKNQTVYALGVSYAATSRLDLRAGFNYGSAPFGDGQVSHNLILPAVTKSHLTLGAGYRINNHWDVAVAAMYAKKYTLTAPATDPQAPNAKIRLGETSVSANIGYRF